MKQIRAKILHFAETKKGKNIFKFMGYDPVPMADNFSDMDYFCWGKRKEIYKNVSCHCFG